MGIFAGALFVICFIFLILLGHKGEKWIEIIQAKFPSRILGKIAGFMLKFVHGLHMLRDNSLILLVSLLSVIIWGIEILNYLLILRSVSIGLPLAAAAFTMVITNLGIMIPSSPGNVGTLQYFSVLALSLFGIAKDHALAYSLILHAEMYFSVTLLGIFFLSHMGISLKSISLNRRKVEELSAE
jgi:uncharacterized protein (TIRG00374 family)